MKELAVYINPRARDSIKQKAIGLAGQLGATIQELKFPISEIEQDAKRIAVVGGDGSVKAVTEVILHQGNKAALLVAGGGSENGFYMALGREGAVVREKELREGVCEELPNYKPGMVNGNPFNHAAGLGEAAAVQGYLTERLRDVRRPNKAWPILAGALTVARYVKFGNIPEYPVQLTFTSSHFGIMKVFPEQGLFADDLTFAKIKGGSRVQMLTRLGFVFGNILLGRRFPQSLVEWDKRKKFEFENTGEMNWLNLDGHVQIPHQHEKLIKIERSTQPIKVGALKL